MGTESRCWFDERVLPVPCLQWLREQAAEISLSIKREMLDAKYSSESHTYHELSEQLTNNISRVLFFSACEISKHKTVLSSNCQKSLTNSSSGKCNVNWLQPSFWFWVFTHEAVFICCPRAGKFSFQCYCLQGSDSEVNSTLNGRNWCYSLFYQWTG